MSKNINLEQTDEILYDKNCTNENVGLYKFMNSNHTKPDMLFILRYANHNSEKENYIVLGRLLNYSKDFKNVENQSLINEKVKKISSLLSAIAAYKNVKNPIISKRMEFQINQLESYMRENKKLFNFESTKEFHDIFVSRDSFSKSTQRTVYIPLAQEKDGTSFMNLTKAPYDINGKEVSSYNNENFGSFEKWDKLNKTNEESKNISKDTTPQKEESSFCEKLKKLTTNQEKSNDFIEIPSNQLEAINAIRNDPQKRVAFYKFINDNIAEYPQIMQLINDNSKANSLDQKKLGAMIANMAVFFQSSDSQKNVNNIKNPKGNEKKEINISENPPCK